MTAGEPSNEPTGRKRSAALSRLDEVWARNDVWLAALDERDAELRHCSTASQCRRVEQALIDLDIIHGPTGTTTVNELIARLERRQLERIIEELERIAIFARYQT